MIEIRFRFCRLCLLVSADTQDSDRVRGLLARGLGALPVGAGLRQRRRSKTCCSGHGAQCLAGPSLAVGILGGSRLLYVWLTVPTGSWAHAHGNIGKFAAQLLLQ